MPRFTLLLGLMLLLGACTVTERSLGLPEGAAPLQRITTSHFPMSRDVWRISVKSNGQIEKETVERAALYRAAELTIERGYERFVVQSTAVGTQARPPDADLATDERIRRFCW